MRKSVVYDSQAFIYWLILILIFFTAQCSGGSYGEACFFDSDCSLTMRCYKNLCICKLNYNTVQIYAGYDYYSATECAEKPLCSNSDMYKTPNWCLPRRRLDNLIGICEDGLCTCKGHLIRGKSDTFRTLSFMGTLNVDHYSTCINPGNEVSKFCSKYSPCDVSVGLECTRSGCLCRGDKIYDFKESKCIDKTSYMSRNGLSEYKVNHGIYCYNDDHCMVGLECNSNRSCSCAYPCNSYIEEKQSCACGEDYGDPSILQIILGVIFGVFSVIFWCVLVATNCPDDDDESDKSENNDYDDCNDDDNDYDNDDDDDYEHSLPADPAPTNDTTTQVNARSETIPTAPPLAVFPDIHNDAPPSYSEVISTSKSYKDFERERQYQSIPLEDLGGATNEKKGY